ncbi:MAG TPA: beta-ketoacyl synthase, partial [Chitinophagaceae bacterium]|nr:beta-ketoacyl synthase [Chitinophagaceae bacterium]
SENYFKSLEPDYDRFVDNKMIRRMSRIVKMGVASAMTCLNNAGVEKPDSILTATAYGCLEDTSAFLRRMIEFEEKLLSPTAFIQSTHNTVGAQIALLLKCHGYNNTIVHRAFSFENALMESRLLLQEGKGPVLVGAIDEITEDRHAILSRFGLYRQTGHYPDQLSGNIAGEGAAFFLLDQEPGMNPLALFRDLRTIYKPEHTGMVQQCLLDFLQDNGLTPEDPDLVLTSHTGNINQDEPDRQLLKAVFPAKPFFPFKSLSGDYPTASGFALWLAALLLKEQKLPLWMQGPGLPLRNILIYHRSGNTHHSFYLISAC